LVVNKGLIVKNETDLYSIVSVLCILKIVNIYNYG